MNVFCLVGNVVELPVLKETTSGVKTCTLKIEVERPFANSDGIIENDIIGIEVWRGLAQTLCNVCVQGDLISCKGRIASRSVEKDGRTFYNYTFVAEKVSFPKKNG